jgi:hypothetical protein
MRWLLLRLGLLPSAPVPISSRAAAQIDVESTVIVLLSVDPGIARISVEPSIIARIEVIR